MSNTGEFAIYDLGNYTFNLGGIPLESGFADGTAIKVEQLEPDFTTKVGADGTVVRSKTRKRLTKITVSFMQTSKANTYMTTLNNVDRAADNGAGVVPLLLRDRGGLFNLAAAEAWIEGPPSSAEFNVDASAREWVIMAARPERFDGGST